MADLAIGSQYRVAFGKQSAEGTAATTADYQVPVYSGLIQETETRNRHEATDTLAYRRGGYKSEAHVEGTITFPSLPRSGARLTNGFLGVDTVTGAGDPYTHTLTPGTPQWFTFWVARPESDGTFTWFKYEDCTIKAIEWQGTAGNPVQMAVEVVGKKGTGALSGGAPTITVTEVLDTAGTDPWHTMIGSTLSLDLDATPATTQVRNITALTVRIARPNLSLIQTDELAPRYRSLGLYEVGFSCDALLTDAYTALLAAKYGSKTASDAAQSGTIVRGAAKFLLANGPAANANRTLELRLPSQEMDFEAPDPDVSGAEVRGNITGMVHAPASGETFTAVFLNSVSTDQDA